MKKDNKGFTLVELIIVIAIIAILGVVAAPQYIKYVEESREATDEQAFDELAHAAAMAYAERYIVDSTETGELVKAADAETIDFSSSTDPFEMIVDELFGTYDIKSTYYTETKITINGATGTWTGRKTD